MRKLVFSALAALPLCASAFAAPAAPRAVFHFEPYRKTIALHANVAGRDGLFVFDTGAGLTLVTPEFAKKANLKTWGRKTGYDMMGGRHDAARIDNLQVVIDGKAFTAPLSGVSDFMSKLPKDAAPVDGLIGLDIFIGEAITIDFPAGTLTLESPASLRERVAGEVEVPASLTREMQGRGLEVAIGVPSARGPVWMELDSGNGGTILVSKPYAALFGLDPAKDGPQPVSFALAPGLTVSGKAFTPDMIIDGNIGMPFLKDVAVTFDLKEGRAWIRPPAR